MRQMKLNALIAIVIIGLGITYAAMHINFVVAHQGFEEKHLQMQLGLAEGKYPDSADFQSRVVFPQLVRATHIIIKKSSWSLFVPEALCAIFAYLSFYLLARTIIGDERYALFSVLALSAFLPYALQLTHRYGEPLMVGFYSILLFCTLKDRPLPYLFFLVLASLQRPDIALSSVFFRMVYDGASRRRLVRLAGDVALLVVPVVIAITVKLMYAIRAEDYINTFYTLGMYRPLKNLQALPSVAMMYGPIIILAGFFFRSFDKTVKMILVSAIPYLILVTFLGSYSESRLLLPVFSIFVIGIIGALHQQDIFVRKGETHNPRFMEN